ncbi:glycosyltransferase family 2 protein [Polynucleobacter sp.]|uniref:glycosyltransferase family 2 protein n=1 Tax=Polynucleobacter sp. TaxID=2029855 RepID=UPI0027339C3C|nr:glycosyltransferase family 2 protein [Polynucleobacter sp.]MDP3122553.1 glycosyltransferase family 2 protein [Polynucleobacter sp.]
MKLITDRHYVGNGVAVYSCQKNEQLRLPFFLEYYRKLGIEHFYIVDNDSSDGSFEYLKNQSDVTLYQTKERYKDSYAGRLWTDYLRDQHGINKWCLTIDTDEFLVYPYSEIYNINDLIKYLEYEKVEGLFCILLDHYPSQKISEVKYSESDSVFSKYPYFDCSSNYTIYQAENFPYIQIKGGVRQRKMWSKNDYKSGPSQKKLPLILYKTGFKYLHSTHSCTPIRLSKITGVLSHFKFIPSFIAYAKNEVKNGARVNPNDYKKYIKQLEGDEMLYDPNNSIKFIDSTTYIRNNFSSCNMNYLSMIKILSGKKNLKLDLFTTPNHTTLDNYILTKNLDLNYSISIESKDEIPYKKMIKQKPNKFNLSNSRLDLEDQSAASTYINQESNKFNLSNSRLDLVDQSAASTYINYRNSISDTYIYTSDYVDSIALRLLRYKSLKITYKLRRLLFSIGMISEKSLIEDRLINLINNKNSSFQIHHAYESIWWDITSPIRIIGKILKRVR